jgi:DUF1009 family protein
MTETGTSTRAGRLGLIAGGGDLPFEIAQALFDSQPFVIRVSEFADRTYDGLESETLSVGQIGTMIKTLKQAECDRICFVGYVQRPDYKKIKIDARGLTLVPKAIAAGRRGDDAIIRVVVAEFEAAGFQVIGADDVLTDLVPGAGVLGAVQPETDHRADIDKALKTASQIGALDIGQGAVVAGGVILAVEAQEGTNRMLERVAALPVTLRGDDDQRLGVLAKVPKPIQERRVDLPTIGVETVERCAAAGLAGIVVEAGGALLVNRDAIIAACDRAGLFLEAVKATDRE